MTDMEKVLEICKTFEISIEHHGDFKDMRSFVELANELAKIVDRYQRKWHRRENDLKIMQILGPSVCN